MVGAFIYYQYSFTSTLKIDFTKDAFYVDEQGGLSLFIPDSERYNICMYSGFMRNQGSFFQSQLHDEIPILGIDFFSQEEKIFKEKNFKLVRISSNLMLKLIHGFNIKTLPQCFIVKQDIKNPMQYMHVKDFGFYKVVNLKIGN